MEEEYCKKASRTIAQVLECPICYNKMKKPKILPCQHTFCWKCLKKIADTTAQNISCAICRSLHDLPSISIEHEYGLPNNLTLVAIFDSMSLPLGPEIVTLTKVTKVKGKQAELKMLQAQQKLQLQRGGGDVGQLQQAQEMLMRHR